MCDVILTELEELIYMLLYNDNTCFNIDLQKYCTFDARPKFRDDIRNILKRAQINILDDRIIHTDITIIWKIEIHRK
jgi:hypothetical protein